jgi:DedD protein
MGLFSFTGKNKQDRAAQDSGSFSRADDEAAGERARSKRASNAGEGARRGREAADPILPEKKRARRRLVGAIALALAVAVGLPMLLDSEPKPLAGDIAIQIPSKDKAAPLPMPADPAVTAADSVDRGEEIVEAGPAKPAAPAQLDPQAIAEVRTGAAREAAVEPARPVAPKAEPARAEPRKAEPPKADLAKAEHKAPPKTEAKPENKVAPKATHDQAVEDARALAILEGKQAGKAAAGEAVVLQVAALGSAEKAAELQAKLREAGIHSFTQKLSKPSGELIRVKVGPYSKDEADKVRARLSRLGLSGTVVPA